MNKRVFLKPKEGLVVPDPEHRNDLPPEGREVNWSAYWARREKEGAIIVSSRSTNSKSSAYKKFGGRK